MALSEVRAPIHKNRQTTMGRISGFYNSGSLFRSLGIQSKIYQETQAVQSNATMKRIFWNGFYAKLITFSNQLWAIIQSHKISRVMGLGLITQNKILLKVLLHLYLLERVLVIRNISKYWFIVRLCDHLIFLPGPTWSTHWFKVRI